MQFPLQSAHLPYLNRLSLMAGKHGTIKPFVVIKDFFQVAGIIEMKKMFNGTCRSALTENYSWHQGCPGNLLYFYERLEMLVEACFLIDKNKKRKRKINRKLKLLFRKKDLQDAVLPSALSATEISDPFVVIQSFFECYTLRQWKKALYAWMEAGLSDFNVLENIEPPSILVYHLQIQKLMDACWYINMAIENAKGKV